jgi:hypothetical protein
MAIEKLLIFPIPDLKSKDHDLLKKARVNYEEISHPDTGYPAPADI